MFVLKGKLARFQKSIDFQAVGVVVCNAIKVRVREQPQHGGVTHNSAVGAYRRPLSQKIGNAFGQPV
jgi:hypothetical protein